MIRTMQAADINKVAEIWLDTNLKAHDFIPPEYWKGNFAAVKQMISQAEVYVYVNEDHNGSGIYCRYFRLRRCAGPGDWKAASGLCEREEGDADIKCVCAESACSTFLSAGGLLHHGGRY